MEKDLLKNDYEKRFKALFYNSPNGMAIVDKDGRWLEVNNEICNMIGYTQDELSKLTFQDITHPEDLEIDIDLYQKILNKEIRDYSLLKRYLRKDGSEIHVLLVVNGIFDENDNFKYFVSQIINLQDIILSEKKLKSINEDLNSFIKIASHDVRQPLRNIDIEINKLYSHCSSNNFNINTHVIEIQKNIKTIGDVLDDFSIYSSIDIDREFDISCFNFQKFVESQFKDKNIRVLESSNICIKKQDLFYLLEQLIANSKKFCYNKYYKITLKCVDTPMDYVITYSDNGIGIPEAFHTKVFLPFFQLEPKRYDGNGIGLAICKKICEKYHGEISITKSSKKGTEFKIIIKK